MIMGGFNFLDPIDFKITPRSKTNVRRSLSGKLYGSKSTLKDILELTFSRAIPTKSEAITTWLYEQIPFGAFPIFIERASSSDIHQCTNAFKGVVEYRDNTSQLTYDPQYTNSFTVSFLINSYENF